MSATVAIAIVSWNTRDLLETCLRSLQPHADAGRAEVWVVDNCSSDGSSEVVADRYPWANLIVSGENLGFGRAVNLVAERTESAWIAASNADIELMPESLEALVAAGERDGSIGVVAPRLIMLDGETQHSVHAFPTVRLATAVTLALYRVVPGLGDRLCIEGQWDPDRRRSVDWAHGAFLLIRRQAFQAVGGFDPRQWLYAEDIDIQWRLARHGWSTAYEPEAAVRHAVSAATTAAFGGGRTARHLTAAYAWLAMRRGAPVAWLCALINAAGAGLRVIALSPVAILAPYRFRPPLRRALTMTRLHARGLRSSSALMRATAPPPALAAGDPAP